MNEIRISEALREMKLELAYFASGVITAALSPLTGPFSIALFWIGMALLSIGWIAIGIKIRALIHLKRIEVLRRAIRENVEGAPKREDGAANENNESGSGNGG
ncbi:hypothetical protein [Ignicoccus islandicus]|uniref:hypothetical protein n=1 Tax=Ignicoccus islandicus TaxID=54259 RepID=UPI0012ECF543|nr:hypothetical protein [Ignicoccus islandicus]